ncbi:hypothetical protein BH11PSE3_BH11PSE3_08580 [soil metagenome]
MGEFHLVHWIVVLSMITVACVVSGYPLAVLCRRTGKSAVIGWLAGTIGIFFCGPTLCLWWLAFSHWETVPAKAR